MENIQKVSRYFLAAFNALIISLPLFVLSTWLLIDTKFMKGLLEQGFFQGPVHTPEGYINLSTVDFTALSKLIGFLSFSCGLLPLFLSFFALKSIFQSYQKGEIFCKANASRYRYLGMLFFLDAFIAKPLSSMLMVLAVTIMNPPGHRIISIGFGTPNVEALFCGTLVIVISWIMQEAGKLHDEQQLTI